jgi:hypothetical protein
MSWVISVRALASVVPSRNRATPMTVNRLDAVVGVDWAAIQASVRASGKENEAGITPTTVVGSPSTVSDGARTSLPSLPRTHVAGLLETTESTSDRRESFRPLAGTAFASAPF